MAKKKAAPESAEPGPQKEAKIRRKRPERPMSWFIVLLMITIFQVWSAVQTIFEEDGSLNAELVSIFGIYIANDGVCGFVPHKFLKRRALTV